MHHQGPVSPTRVGAVAAVLAVLAASTGDALERETVPAPDEPDREWSAGGTCSVSYYNTCTGWIWRWTGYWEHLERVGMVVDPCCSEDRAATLVATNYYFWDGAPPERGYTGLAFVATADENGCPGTELASQLLLPRDGDNVVLWGIPITGPVVVGYELASWYGTPNPTEFVTDHPAPGPTGPAACGFCYPADRLAHSFFYGTTPSPLCPGSPLDGGVL